MPLANSEEDAVKSVANGQLLPWWASLRVGGKVATAPKLDPPLCSRFIHYYRSACTEEHQTLLASECATVSVEGRQKGKDKLQVFDTVS